MYVGLESFYSSSTYSAHLSAILSFSLKSLPFLSLILVVVVLGLGCCFVIAIGQKNRKISVVFSNYHLAKNASLISGKKKAHTHCK